MNKIRKLDNKNEKKKRKCTDVEWFLYILNPEIN